VSSEHIISHIICLATLQTVILVNPAQNDKFIGNVKGFETSFTGTGSIKKFSIEEDGVRSEC
jgi:hypothetical protein